MRNPFRKTGKRELNLPKNLSKAQEKEILQIIRKARSDDGIPRSAQESIPFQRMFPDGICRVTDHYYTLTIQYQDINYQLAQQEDKTAIFEEWCAFLNSFDSSIHFELSFMNMATDAESFEKKVRIPYRNDHFNGIRNEYSQMLRTQLAQGNNGLTKTKYITFGIEADSMREAKPRLQHVQTDMMNNLKRLGVSARVLNGRERLQLMHAMFHMGDHDRFFFDWIWLAESGLSVKDFIAPTSFSFPGSRTFTMGDLKGAMSYLQITASDLSDQMLKDFLDMESSQIVTMHVQSVNQTTAIKQIKHTITELDRSKIEEQKKAVRSGYDMDIIPSDLATYGKDAKALLEELQSQNERMFLITFLIMNTGKTDQELENNVFQASSIAQKHNCNLRRLDFQQEQGLMSSLPLANNLIEIQRALTTSSTAIFVPFTTQELFQTGSEALYYGLNALSNNLIMVDRKKLKNPNGLILGTPGSGKSFSAKREIANAFLVTDDDVIVCNPEAEYTALVQKFEGQVIKISPSSTQYINPMDINANYLEEDNPIALKADFILSLCELIVGGKEGLQPVEKTVIDRCVYQIYQTYFENPVPENMPVLQDLYEALLRQDEKEAHHVATADEKFRKMITEAEKYLGYPYVWGGSSPSTSFDCSGFVSWVINHCGNGWNVGRQTANGLMGKCDIIPKSEAKPGDLIFFQKTYNTSRASHVGIYVGNGMMLHCGSPISYASIEASYWRQEPLRLLHLPIRVRMGRRIRLSVLLLRKQMWRKAQMQGKQTVTATSKSIRICRCCRMATKSLRMRMGT